MHPETTRNVAPRHLHIAGRRTIPATSLPSSLDSDTSSEISSIEISEAPVFRQRQETRSTGAATVHGRNLLKNRTSLYGFPTLDRLGANDFGTIRNTLNRPDRGSTIRRAPLILRSPSEEPPTARLGATRISGSLLRPGNVDDPEHKTHPAHAPKSFNYWEGFARILTCCFIPPLLKIMGKKHAIAQQAWREKVALCFIIFLLCSIVGFLTFGIEQTFCPPPTEESLSYFNTSDFSMSTALEGNVIIRGYAYQLKNVSDRLTQWNGMDINGLNGSVHDLTLLFTPPENCQKFTNAQWTCEQAKSTFTKVIANPALYKSTHSCPSLSILDNVPRQRVVFSWTDLNQHAVQDDSNLQLLVFNGIVLNVTNIPNLSAQTTKIISEALSANLDITHTMLYSQQTREAAQCLTERVIIGYLESTPVGCLAATTIQTISLIVILALVFVKFVMAIYFYWRVSGSLVKPDNKTRCHIMHVEPNYDPHPYTIMLVTCYSEGEESIKATLDSLTKTDYPDDCKLLFVVCDGLVTGSGNSKSTPDLVLGLMQLDFEMEYPRPASYLAIAEGPLQHNMGYAYSGHYVSGNHRVAAIIVVKCGTADEALSQKPGNRGKRDSQLILMNFLSRCLFNDRMTPLDHQIQSRIHNLMQIHPSQFSYVLMVDADTSVAPPALQHMINAMLNDRNIMGICGETRIRNKRDSWVTRIQVFEYYASHHLGKAFESIFGGVTCLPGCFSMYRIKISKGYHDGRWVPLLVNPDIVQEYSENTVHTLHKKNLLLLGEDRFLSTLMLRNFPRRKMMFCPQAVCYTVVPDEFRVLLSQRRRWINSTIHNLMELILVRDLCGIFCFSMQFVVFVELIGTLVLPAAISFTIFLLIQTFVTGQVQLIPMLLLVFILGLPGLLIVVTTRRVSYIGWLGIYLLSLPLWNFVMPLYAFWHFDDFSWGQTRVVNGETKSSGGHGESEGKVEAFDVSKVPLKTFDEWNSILAHRRLAREIKLKEVERGRKL